MRAEKSEITAYTSVSRNSGDSKPPNIFDLTRRNKQEEIEEKKIKIKFMIAAATIIFIFVIFQFL